MARYRKIDPRIWNDERFRSFTDDGKLAFVFVLTHPAMTAVGAMRGTAAGLGAELGWLPHRMADAIRDAISLGMVDVDPKACFIGAPNFLRYNEPEGPNSVAKAWVEALDLIPECAGKRRVIARCRAYLDEKSKAFRLALPHAIWDAFPVAKGDASPIQEQEQEPEQKNTLSPARASASETESESPGVGGGHRTDPKANDAQANASSGEGATPQPPDGGEELRPSIAAGEAAAGRGALSAEQVERDIARRLGAEDGERIRGGLPTQDELRAAKYPRVAELLAAIRASGEPSAEWPKANAQCVEADRALGAQELDVVVPRVLAAIRESCRVGLGWHIDAIRGGPRPKRDSGSSRGMAPPSTDWPTETREVKL